MDLRSSEWFGEDFAQDFRKSLCIRVTSEGVRSLAKSSENTDLKRLSAKRLLSFEGGSQPMPY